MSHGGTTPVAPVRYVKLWVVARSFVLFYLLCGCVEDQGVLTGFAHLQRAAILVPFSSSLARAAIPTARASEEADAVPNRSHLPCLAPWTVTVQTKILVEVVENGLSSSSCI
jgi:hypothetical protein